MKGSVMFMKKRVFGVLLIFTLAVLLSSRQSADAAANDYEMVPTATDGKTVLLNANGNRCVNVAHGYNDEDNSRKIYSTCCNSCGGWIYTCYNHKLELSEEKYVAYSEENADRAHATYSAFCSASFNSGHYSNSTRIYYKTEVYKVTDSESVTLSD